MIHQLNNRNIGELRSIQLESMMMAQALDNHRAALINIFYPLEPSLAAEFAAEFAEVRTMQLIVSLELRAIARLIAERIRASGGRPYALF